MRRIREIIRWILTFLLFPLHIPHFFFYSLGGGGKMCINEDIEKYKLHFHYDGCPTFLYLLYLLTIDRYYRQIFYNRIGPFASTLIGWYRPGDKYFSISKDLKIGGGFMAFHPYATVLNAEKIGNGFSCAHCTTLGRGKSGKPIIGNNVHLGAAVTIIGGVHIGNNVTIGAGSVVVKDIPDNCVAVGNPAKVIKSLPPISE